MAQIDELTKLLGKGSTSVVPKLHSLSILYGEEMNFAKNLVIFFYEGIWQHKTD